VAYTVVVRLASGGAAGALGGGEPGTGYTIYSQSFLLIMVPHAVVTVSLATAVLPRLSTHAAERDLSGVGRNLSSTLRTALAVIVPFAVLLPLVAEDLANLAYGWGAASEAYPDYARPLSLFGVALVFFTVHFLVLRGFYSLERTRTVFLIQCVIATVNIGLAVLLTRSVAATDVSSALALAYLGAYASGAALSYGVLRHALGGLETPRLAAFLGRLAVATAGAFTLAWLVRYGVTELWPEQSKVRSVTLLAAVTVLCGGVYLLLARLLRIREVTGVLQLVRSRVGRGRAS
jgi:putative peptidoglycan lipid II flippase